MSFLIGLLSGLGAALLAWQFAVDVSVNLPSSTALAIVVALTAVAGVVAFLAGSALCRRARRSREHLALFGSVAFAVAGGILGAACAVAVTAAYLQTYGAWPDNPVDLVLTGISYPIFALLGFALGAIAGAIVGVVASGALRILSPAPR